MKQYLDMMRHIVDNGAVKEDRTGTGTISVFGHQMRFDLSEGFPLVTTKKCHLRSIIHELLWFLKGDTNIKYLNDNNVSIWDEWADDNGELGPVYGKQWRSWDTADGFTIDQIRNAIYQLENFPDSRRIIVSAWNVGDLDQMALMPCHAMFQFYTRELTTEERFEHWLLNADRHDVELWNQSYELTAKDWATGAFGLDYPTRELSCQLYQRSADTFLGVPFNIASYALLTHMMAQQCNMLVGDFVWTGGDVHLYSNHMTQVNAQLLREPRALPRLVIKRKPETIFGYKFEDFEIVGYDPHPAIKAPVAV